MHSVYGIIYMLNLFLYIYFSSYNHLLLMQEIFLMRC
nr:MAG TPA: hypothetical protein [Caudoviricetes sp.]